MTDKKLVIVYKVSTEVKCFFCVSAISAKKARKAAQVQQPRTKEQRAEMKQKNYRYLYQIRTAHGDIISQVSNFNTLRELHTFNSFIGP